MTIKVDMKKIQTKSEPATLSHAGLDAEIKVRVTSTLKAALAAIATTRSSMSITITPSDVAREAIFVYLDEHGYPPEKLEQMGKEIAAAAVGGSTGTATAPVRKKKG